MATISNNPYHTPKDGEYTVQNIMVNTYTANNVVITDPIPNTTSALFTYTVNPAVPNGATYVPSSIFANVAFT